MRIDGPVFLICHQKHDSKPQERPELPIIATGNGNADRFPSTPSRSLNSLPVVHRDMSK